MSIFLASTDVLQVVLDAAPTNQLPINTSWVDQGGLGGNQPSLTNGVTPVTVVPSPAATVERLVSKVSIPNADTSTRIVTVNVVRSGAPSRECKITLLPGYALYYDGRWMVLDSSGNFLSLVTVTGGTLTANQGAAAAITAPWPVELSNGTNAVGTASAPLRTDPTGTTTQPVSIAGTLPFNLTQVDSVALGAPVAYGSTPTGNAISVNAFVTNGGAGGSSNITEWNSVALGSPSNYGTSPGAVEVIGTNAFVTNTVTVDDTTANLAQASTTSGQTGVMAQGAATTAAPTYTTAKTYPLSLNLAGGLRVDGSGVTQPVSLSTLPPLVAGSAAIGTVGVTSLPSIPAGSNVVGGVTQSGAWTVTTTPPSNASTNLSQLDGVALGAPSNYGTSPGAVAVQGVNAFITNTVPVTGTFFQATQPVSGTVTANQGTSPWVVSLASTAITGTVAVTQSTSPWTIQGDSASGAANAGNPVKVGCVFNTTQPTVTTGQTVDGQATSRGAQIVATGVDTFNVTVNSALPAGANAIGSVSVSNFPSSQAVTGTFFQATQPVSGTVAATQSGAWTVQPGNTANTTAWLVTGTGGTFPSTQSGTWNVGLSAGSNTIGTVNQGTANATPWNENIAQWGGTATSLGQKVSASSVPVVLASDQSSVGVLPAPMQGCGYLSLTTTANSAFVTLSGASATASTKIRAIVIDLVAFTVSGAVNIRIFDGSNNQVWQHTFPVTGASTTMYGAYSMSDLNIPLANTGTAPYVNLTAATTTGYIGISVFLS